MDKTGQRVDQPHKSTKCSLKHHFKMKAKSRHFFFHDLLQRFRTLGIKGRHLLCGVSGGVDSVCLLHLLLELKSVLDLKISVVCVHHNSKTKKQNRFQSQASRLVKNLCTASKSPFYAFKAPASLVDKGGGEALLRTWRYQCFKTAFKRAEADFVVLAHHADDLLETRLIRLIRGTGTQGLRAMSFKKGRLLRPLLYYLRSDIQEFAKSRKLKWLEDPTNLCTHYSLRNWIRHQWLKDLEKHRKGSVKTLSRSLNVISSSFMARLGVKEVYQKSLTPSGALNRSFFDPLPEGKKAFLLTCFIRKKGIKNHSFNHVQEVLKRLHTKTAKTQSFSLLGWTWCISKKTITINS